VELEAVSSVHAVSSSEIEAATNHFDVSNIVGRGGSGCVYRGTMRGRLVAVKRLSPSTQMQKHFLRELQVRNATISETWQFMLLTGSLYVPPRASCAGPGLLCTATLPGVPADASREP
jgi:hypothetical protein